MSPELAYFLKVNVAFALFYTFYRLFFYKDTFFKLRRAILLAFFGLALVYPLFNIQEWIKGQEPIAEVIFYYSLIITPVIEPVTTPAHLPWWQIITGSIGCVYLAGIFILVVRFFSQLGSIVWLAQKSEKVLLKDVKVYALKKPAGPFSFFRWIFMHPESHSESETEEILTHELTHVNQWHSVDVLLSELICIVCWFNPFVWLLKKEVRHNLEYLADNTVLESGYDSRSYQYHLLGLAHHHKGSTQLYNSFNVLHLKNRIGMMNKKRSRGIGRTKYLMFAPLVILLMIVNNIEAVARITSGMAKEINPSLSPLLSTGKEFTVNKLMEFTGIPSTGSETQPDATEMQEEVFTVVEHMPAFPGGDNALLAYLQNHLIYPKDAENAGIEGRVIASFVVNKKGEIRNPQITRGVHPSLDEEAIRVIRNMPLWRPGKRNDEAVDTKYTVPVQFRLSETNRRYKADDMVFTVVERMPRFPGGDRALLQHINSMIKYPVIAQENGIQGRVIVSMVVGADGNVTDTQIVRGIDPSLDKEAIRVVSSLPRWEPGEQRGKKVPVKYTVPIQFRLQ